MSLYDRSVRVLMREMVESMQLAPGQTFTRDDARQWFKAHYPLVRDGAVVAHLACLSTNNKTRLHYRARADDDVLFQVDSTRFRRFDPASDPLPIREGMVDAAASTSAEAGESTDEPGSSQFAYEHDLRDYLARNLHLIEPGLQLYEDEGVTGIEFPAGGWIEMHQADPGQSVRGVIVAKDVSDDLRLACSRITGVKLFEYQLSVSLKPVAVGLPPPE